MSGTTQVRLRVKEAERPKVDNWRLCVGEHGGRLAPSRRRGWWVGHDVIQESSAVLVVMPAVGSSQSLQVAICANRAEREAQMNNAFRVPEARHPK